MIEKGKLFKDILNGREPRSPDSWEVFGDSMIQGGGLLLYGDAIATDWSSPWQSFASHAAGPSTALVGKALKLGAKAGRGKLTGKDVQRAALDITPGLPIVKSLIMRRMYEEAYKALNE